ncbi:TonB-dependent receptor [Mucilaginibacter mallensis]|nr:TonB-dependent receptor [Mucilaginibacter mallensis]
MKNLFVAIFALLLPVMASAQFSVSGKITDGQTGTTLPGATVTIQNSTASAVADAFGKYTINNLNADTYTLKVSYIGYQTSTQKIVLNANTSTNFILTASTVLTDEVTVSGTRAAVNSPTAYTNLSRKDIQKNNLGQDLPFLLNQTPSVVVTSDAGAGIGYTGIHIRGSDATRINVTINGIPYNDSEEQGVYFVDLPDFASSVDNIQIQRGVGTSTNGAGAFGASINIQTTTRRDTAYLELNNSAGSYGTVKNTINIGTGLLGGKFSFDGRLSRIYSDGYIDRAFSNLKSYFLSGAYYGKNTLIRFNTFSGTEHTYQAWDGINEDSLRAGNRTYNDLGIIGNPSDNNFYKNQTDNYTQDHYQLLVDQKISDKISFNGALHYTHGYGYYEEYQNADSIKNYGLVPNKGDTTTDLTRRLWLNNKFYGVTYNFKYAAQKNLNFDLGGAYNEYRGAHYDNIEWTQQYTGTPPDYQYARDDAFKTDFNIYGKVDYRIDKLTLYADMQYRHISYSFLGFNDQLQNVQQQVKLDFFNPKAGLSYQIDTKNNLYASFAVGNHEPDRDDYTQSTPADRPKPENLKDFELGYRTQMGAFTGGINAFYMLYYNQLVLTGQLNDVGDQNRSNVKNSFREGLEFDGRLRITNQLTWSATASWSANKVKDFNQYLLDNDNGQMVNYQYKETDIAFSPDFVGSSEISYVPAKGAEIAFISKYVSRQYLDNTSNINPPGYAAADPTSNRYLNSYFVNGIRLSYNFSIKSVKNIGVSLLINNIFNEQYEANGATYPDIDGGKVVNNNYFFAQAPANFLVGLNLKF